MVRLTSLTPVRFNNWVIKASIFDDQILLICMNLTTMKVVSRMFYCEEHAYQFMEKFVKV